MKRICALVLAAVMALAALPGALAAADEDTVRDVVSMLGIMNGDGSGDLKLSSNVTRAEFVRMMVAASVYEGSVGTGGRTSPFTDVKAGYWACEYIKTAVGAGWVSGYTDGTFRPNDPVTLDHAAAALMNLLGYTQDDLKGSYPTAQIAKLRALELDEGFTAAQGQRLTRRDCMYLFYNLMGAKSKAGQVYGVTLGYAMNADGEIDYDKLMDKETKGPFVLAGTALSLPFEPLAVYRDGRLSASGALAQYDVYYYNERARTVRAYSDKAVGMYTAAAPNRDEPTSVTVGGKTYTLSGKDAKTKLSRQGAFSYGDTVVLLLDKNGAAVDALAPGKSEVVYYGVVTGQEYKSYQSDRSGTLYGWFITVLCTDGAARTFTAEKKGPPEGRPCLAGVQNGAVVVSSLSNRTMGGAFSADGTQFGRLKLSPDAEIMDYVQNGRYAAVYPARLAGCSLSDSDVLFYATNAAGEISHLILNDATGDMNDYVLLTGVSEQSAAQGFNGAYDYLKDGVPGKYTAADTLFGVEKGPAMLAWLYEKVDKMKNLPSVKLDLLSESRAVAGAKEYRVYDDVQVYIERDGAYYAAEISDVTDPAKYAVTGYYDDHGYAAGGRLRILIAKAK